MREDRRRRYDDGFRREALELIKSGAGKDTLASRLAIPVYTARNWIGLYRSNGEEAVMGGGGSRRYDWETKVAAARGHVENGMDWLQCIGQSDEAIRGFKLNMLLYELLSLLYSRFVSGVRRPELVRSGRNITMQIIGYMTSHRKQHLEATDVAREFGYGREHFCRLFRKATGKTFKEFLTDLRLDDACRKLSGSSASIASIARECGFPDTRALQTAVQRKYGIRAQEYRERYENRN